MQQTAQGLTELINKMMMMIEIMKDKEGNKNFWIILKFLDDKVSIERIQCIDQISFGSDLPENKDDED